MRPNELAIRSVRRLYGDRHNRDGAGERAQKRSSSGVGGDDCSVVVVTTRGGHLSDSRHRRAGMMTARCARNGMVISLAGGRAEIEHERNSYESHDEQAGRRDSRHPGHVDQF